MGRYQADMTSTSERFLHDIFGRRPVAQHHVGQPDQPERVLLVEGGYRGFRGSATVGRSRPGGYVRHCQRRG